ncbi:MAG TPA: hypothetical protein VMW10_11585 [Alphaproteobacteria bacterium]|nr:hypothetical protein [Alphaproteobacteria bacterium]
MTKFKVKPCLNCKLRYRCPFYDIVPVGKKFGDAALVSHADISSRLGSALVSLVHALNFMDIREDALMLANCVDKIFSEILTLPGENKRLTNYTRIEIKEGFFQDAISEL